MPASAVASASSNPATNTTPDRIGESTRSPNTTVSTECVHDLPSHFVAISANWLREFGCWASAAFVDNANNILAFAKMTNDV